MNYLKTKKEKIGKMLKEKLLNKEISEFHYRVYDFVKTIPRGKTATYKEVAVSIGRPKAYRAVGNALNKNPFPFGKLRASCSAVPCHRVIKSNGEVGGFASGTQKKIQLLSGELKL